MACGRTSRQAALARLRVHSLLARLFRCLLRPPSPTPPSQALPLSQIYWEAYRPAPESHPYLVRKRIGAHGARVAADQLVVPLTDTLGAVHGLQYISGDGAKKFLFGSKVKGRFFLVGNSETTAPLYLAEGFATAATIHEAMGGQAAVAFNAGNLKPAAQELRRQWPGGRTGRSFSVPPTMQKPTAIQGFPTRAQRPRPLAANSPFPISVRNVPMGPRISTIWPPEAVDNSIRAATSAFPALDNLVELSIVVGDNLFELARDLLSASDYVRQEVMDRPQRERIECAISALVLFLVQLFLLEPAVANTVIGMPWETPLQKIKNW